MRRLADEEKIALVLQGGGALGAYQAGAFEALAEGGYCPQWFAGISIGAINAAIICGNPPDRRVKRLRAFWEEVTSGAAAPFDPGGFLGTIFAEASANMAAMFGVPGFFRPRVPPPALPWPYPPTDLSFYDTTPLRRTLAELIDFDLINEKKTRLSVGAVNIRTGNFEYFDNERIEIRLEHVLASGALPPGFPPVEIDGELYWDGGLVSNTPLQYVLDSCDRKDVMCVFQVDLFGARGPAPETLLDAAQREKDIRYSSRTRLNTDLLKRAHNLRAAVKKLSDKLPRDLQNDPDWLALNEIGDVAGVTIAHLIHRRAAYERQSKDYEFSRATMRDHWHAGAADARTTITHPDWLARTPPDEGVVVFDCTKDFDNTGDGRPRS
jgi:NTE family protein